MCFSTPLPEELARSISAYVGCIAGASLLNDYLTTALDAGLRDLAIPRIAIGADLMAILSPENATSGSSCCSPKGTSSGKSTCCGATISVASLKNPNDLVHEAAAVIGLNQVARLEVRARK